MNPDDDANAVEDDEDDDAVELDDDDEEEEDDDGQLIPLAKPLSPATHICRCHVHFCVAVNDQDTTLQPKTALSPPTKPCMRVCATRV